MGRQYTVLEINNQDMRILVGRKHKAHAQIQHIYHLALPQNARSAQDVYDPAVLIPFLKDIFSSLGLKKKHLIVSIVEKSLTCYTHLFPTSSIKNLDGLVDRFVMNLSPKASQHYGGDYTILSSGEEGIWVRINLLDQALTKSLYDSFTGAGLQPIALIPHSDALDCIMGSAKLLNLVQHDIKSPYGLIDYQGDTISLSLFQNGHLIFYQALYPKANLDNYNFLEILNNTYLGQYPSTIPKSMHPKLFYLSGTIKNPIKAREILEKRLGKPVAVIRATSAIQYAKPHSAEIVQNLTAAGCILLAPFCLRKKHLCSNFFKTWIGPKIKRKRIKVLLGAAILALILTFTLLLWNQQSKLNKARNDLMAEQVEFKLLQNEARTRNIHWYEQEITATKQQLNQLLKAIDSIKDEQNWNSEQIRVVTNLTPEDIILEEIDGNPDTLFIQAHADSRLRIAKYEALLKDSSQFEEIFISHISSLNVEGVPTYTFTVECTLEKGGSENES